MIIYKHEENFRGEIETKKLEAIEHEDLYILKNCSRVSKEYIGKILKIGFRKMYTLTPDNTPFIKALIEEKERDVKLYTRALEKSVARKTELLKLLDEKGAAAHGDTIPATDSGEI